MICAHASYGSSDWMWYSSKCFGTNKVKVRCVLVFSLCMCFCLFFSRPICDTKTVMVRHPFFFFSLSLFSLLSLLLETALNSKLKSHIQVLKNA